MYDLLYSHSVNVLRALCKQTKIQNINVLEANTTIKISQSTFITCIITCRTHVPVKRTYRRSKTHPKRSRATIVAGIVEHTLGGKRESTVLTQTTRSVVHREQILNEMRPCRARGPVHCFLQNSNTSSCEILDRALNQTVVSCNNYTLSIIVSIRQSSVRQRLKVASSNVLYQ